MWHISSSIPCLVHDSSCTGIPSKYSITYITDYSIPSKYFKSLYITDYSINNKQCTMGCLSSTERTRLYPMFYHWENQIIPYVPPSPLQTLPTPVSSRSYAHCPHYNICAWLPIHCPHYNIPVHLKWHAHCPCYNIFKDYMPSSEHTCLIGITRPLPSFSASAKAPFFSSSLFLGWKWFQNSSSYFCSIYFVTRT